MILLYIELCLKDTPIEKDYLSTINLSYTIIEYITDSNSSMGKNHISCSP